jgi:hypothetical protein
VSALVETTFEEELIEEAREGLIEWFRSAPPDRPLYATPDGDILTARGMAEALREPSELGESYLELFLAGVVLDRGEDGARDYLRGHLRDMRGDRWRFS